MPLPSCIFDGIVAVTEGHTRAWLCFQYFYLLCSLGSQIRLWYSQRKYWMLSKVWGGKKPPKRLVQTKKKKKRNYKMWCISSSGFPLSGPAGGRKLRKKSMGSAAPAPWMSMQTLPVVSGLRSWTSHLCWSLFRIHIPRNTLDSWKGHLPSDTELPHSCWEKAGSFSMCYLDARIISLIPGTG